ncbi:hypothetical protein [Dokdonella soli]|uniref:Uncharacterized protein n=1 Tax=Dokdonella soli TaxID=529810 RepID=A0ABN1IV55_9GAMM
MHIRRGLAVAIVFGSATTVWSATDRADVARMTSANAVTQTNSYGIGVYAIVAGGIVRSSSSCFELSGAIGQPVPGHSSGGAVAVGSGFWSVAPVTRLDEIFFNGFEGC